MPVSLPLYRADSFRSSVDSTVHINFTCQQSKSSYRTHAILGFTTLLCIDMFIRRCTAEERLHDAALASTQSHLDACARTRRGQNRPEPAQSMAGSKAVLGSGCKSDKSGQSQRWELQRHDWRRTQGPKDGYGTK